MNNYKKALIEEHSQLVIRIRNLNDYIYSDKSDKDDKIEFANKCIQLASMTKYEEALHARIENAGITFDGSNYFEHVAAISHTIAPPIIAITIPDKGSDYDVDEKCKSSNTSESNG